MSNKKRNQRDAAPKTETLSEEQLKHVYAAGYQVAPVHNRRVERSTGGFKPTLSEDGTSGQF